MKLIYDDIFLEHDTGMHPENAKRLLSFAPLKKTEVINGEKYLSSVHSPAYVSRVKEACSKGMPLDQETITSKKSFDAATRAVGATIMASEQNDFALVRPPGHHAHRTRASGFCIFNNIAIATQHLVNSRKKVFIFDFDGHLGDGTFDMFYDTDKVLYWSLHQKDAFPFKGSVDDVGKGKGKGYTILTPLPNETGDDMFMKAVNHFMPVAQKFEPDIVAVSAGFDAHHSDLLLNLRLTYNTYYEIGKLLSNTFKDVFATLEGGYNVDTLAPCVYSFMQGVNGEKHTYKEDATDTKILAMEEIELTLDTLQKNLQNYWS